MTDQFTFLSPASLRDIIFSIDKSLEIFARHGDRLAASEHQVQRMLVALRARVAEQLANHPDREQ